MVRYFDGHGNEVTDKVVGLEVENKRLRMDVEILENEVERLKKQVKRKRRGKVKETDAISE